MIDQRDLNGFTELELASGLTPWVNILQCFCIYGETTNIHYLGPSGWEYVVAYASNGDMLTALDGLRTQLLNNKGLQFFEIIDTTLSPQNTGYFINLREMFSFCRNVDLSSKITFASHFGASLDYDCVTGTNYKTVLHYIMNLVIQKGMMIDSSTPKQQ